MIGTLYIKNNAIFFVIHHIQNGSVCVWPVKDEPALQTCMPGEVYQSRSADSNQSLFRSAGALWTGGDHPIRTVTEGGPCPVDMRALLLGLNVGGSLQRSLVMY